jgi:RNA polymerase sigma-70 factor (ECF subfamily)
MAGADSGDVLDWRAMRPGLVRFLARRTGSAAAAEDLTQDLWLRMDRLRRGAAEEIRNPTAYLFRAAANLARDHLRAEKRRTALNAEALALVMIGLPHAGVATPDSEAEANEHLARVDAAIAALPPRTREIFAMNRFEGIAYREIARRLGISTTAVEKHMRRALDALAGLRDDDDAPGVGR